MNTRLPQLDGLRGIAILGVLGVHYSWAAPIGSPHTLFSLVKHVLLFGWMGVDLFFVLSGFLIGGILIAGRDQPAGEYFKNFYARRFFRIVPLYALVLSLYVATGFTEIDAFVGTGTAISPLWYATFTQNVEGALYDDVYAFGQSWSLAVEEQFYLVAPLTIWLIPSRWLPRVISGLVVSAILFRVALMVFGNSIGRAVYTLLPCRMDALLIGVGCAWIVAHHSQWLNANKGAVRTGFFVSAIVTLIFVALNWQQQSPEMTSVGLTITAITFGLMLIVSLLDSETARLLAFRPLGWIGRRAYFFYLFHLIFPTAAFLIAKVEFGLRDPLQFVVFGFAMIAMICCAELSWRFFESPLINVARNFNGSPLEATRPI